ncbi:hypothetical protein FHR72_000636 [Mycolicibacterium iranicum]|uniref:Uncharacterized protein n=1 Tax=Mycolicibacterium iranicum TaxID=912594 RepID=A0A839Q094_MYCIR|nr:hypothetical protein [Mycolicibacterium iranicum]
MVIARIATGIGGRKTRDDQVRVVHPVDAALITFYASAQRQRSAFS